MDIMLDLETLGKKPGCVVLSIGAMVFNPKQNMPVMPAPPMPPIQPGQIPSSFVQGITPPPAPFYANIDIFGQLMLGLYIDPETVDWWMGKSDEAKRALCHPRPEPVGLVVDRFHKWCQDSHRGEPEVTVWARSPDFDCAIWEHVCKLLNIEPVWDFRNKRDVRTVIDMRRLVPSRSLVPMAPISKVGTHHNALDDCQNQINEVLAALKGLSYGGTPEN